MRAPAGPLRAGDSRPRVLPGAGRSEEGRQRLWWLIDRDLPKWGNPRARDSDSVGLETLTSLSGNYGYPSFRSPQALPESSRIFWNLQNL